MKKVLFAAALVALGFGTLGISSAEDTEGLDAASKKALEQAVAASQRSDANRARDKYRHPVETLGFFGVKPSDTVVEIWPGGGWYTEILAPYLAAGRRHARTRSRRTGASEASPSSRWPTRRSTAVIRRPTSRRSTAPRRACRTAPPTSC